MKMAIQLFIHSTEFIYEFISDFLIIPKRSLQYYRKLLGKFFTGTTCMVLYLAASNLQQHTIVSPVVKGLLFLYLIV